MLRAEFFDGVVARAGGEVVVDDAAGLHEGVADGRTDEAEAESLQFAVERAGGVGLGGHVGRRLPPGRRFGVGPDDLRERAVLGVERQGGGGVGDRGVDFASVADDAGVGQQGFAVGVGGCGDSLEVPVPEGVAVAVAAGEDRAPGEAGLS